MSARFVVGIDLGTTNTAVAYVDTLGLDEGDLPEPRILELPQLTAPGQVEERSTLPSFIYLAAAGELAAGALDLPWAAGRDYAVGEWARGRGAEVPARTVSSAKSWLSHAGVDRTSALLPAVPLGAEPPDLTKISPVDASARILQHVREAWDHVMAAGDPDAALGVQDVFLTVPASFDAVARELTVRAAAAAGLPRVTLLEEPQSAFYSWLATMGDGWRKALAVGDLVVVCDVGGGTTDFSLISVGESAGTLAVERVAVGDHILLGGDNMDLALAYRVAARLAEQGTQLDAWQQRALTHACRGAKEAVLAGAESAPIAVLGRGRSVIGGSVRTELTRADAEAALLGGFFPLVPSSARPQVKRRVGLRELGLPYADDAGVTRHLARFLGNFQGGPSSPSSGEAGRASPTAGRATAVLYNGGVMKGPALRARVSETLTAWAGETGAPEPKVLEGTDLDLAVAHGAAYYGLVRRGKGVRIRGGTARAYYIGIERAAPAVPGMAAPLSALCVAPFGMEEGSEAELPGQEFGLVVGEPAEFRVLTSVTRRDDAIGTLIEDVGPAQGLEEGAAIEAALTGSEGQLVPVRLRSRVTEVGTLELWCVARDGQRWKLEWSVREAAL